MNTFTVDMDQKRDFDVGGFVPRPATEGNGAEQNLALEFSGCRSALIPDGSLTNARVASDCFCFPLLFSSNAALCVVYYARFRSRKKAKIRVRIEKKDLCSVRNSAREVFSWSQSENNLFIQGTRK